MWRQSLDCHSGARAKRGSPESITTAWEYGFRARAFGAPRNDGWRRRLVALAVIVIGAHGSASAQTLAQTLAQTWPSKPIRAIVPFGAGSATDIVPRIVFDPLSAQLGQPIIVENRVGAGSMLG